MKGIKQHHRPVSRVLWDCSNTNTRRGKFWLGTGGLNLTCLMVILLLPLQSSYAVIGGPAACGSTTQSVIGDVIDGDLSATTDCFISTQGRLTDRFALRQRH